MKIKKCDRCKAEILPPVPPKNVFEALGQKINEILSYEVEYRITKLMDGIPRIDFDLCEDCQKKLQEWLRAEDNEHSKNGTVGKEESKRE